MPAYKNLAEPIMLAFKRVRAGCVGDGWDDAFSVSFTFRKAELGERTQEGCLYLLGEATHAFRVIGSRITKEHPGFSAEPLGWVDCEVDLVRDGHTAAEVIAQLDDETLEKASISIG